MIYLDYAATTPVDGEVLEAMLPYLRENFANPDSAHAAGRKVALAVSEARARVAAILGMHPLEVFFTSGGTEADNWAVRRLAKGKVAVSSIEHAAVLESAKLREEGHKTILVAADGIVPPEAVASAIDEETGLVCVMAANNETGCIQKTEEIYQVCRERKVVFFSDCVQAAGELDLKEIAKNCDALSLSGHKIYAPKGIGVLAVKKGTKLSSLIAGGEQERSLRGGTLNAAGIAGFACALEKAQKNRARNAARVRSLRDLFEREILSAFGERVRIDGGNRLANISHLTFADAGDAFLAQLDLAGLCASGGSACSSHSALPSHVMLAMGRTEEEARRGARFSFGRDTSEKEVLEAAKIVCEVLKRD